MTLVVWVVAVLAISAVLALIAVAGYCLSKKNVKRKRIKNTDTTPATVVVKPPYKISYVPSDIEWSGSTSGTMPLKTLTYKQYECLEDARYGFKVVGVTPTERKKEQPHKTRAHGLKTVASLVKHGFLMSGGADGHMITDHGLNALEVCDVRY